MIPFSAYNVFWWVIAALAIGYAEWVGLKSPADVYPTGTDLLRLLPDWLLALGLAVAAVHLRISSTLIETFMRLIR